MHHVITNQKRFHSEEEVCCNQKVRIFYPPSSIFFLQWQAKQYFSQKMKFVLAYKRERQRGAISKCELCMTGTWRRDLFRCLEHHLLLQAALHPWQQGSRPKPHYGSRRHCGRVVVTDGNLCKPLRIWRNTVNLVLKQ